MPIKLIGVTARVLLEDDVRKQFVNERYLVPLHKRGFNTLMLTLDNPHLEELLALCDGFLVTGGTDVDPKYFHEENAGESKGCDSSLDDLDRMVVEYAHQHELPMLGICRGHQTINVFLGGSLFQDIGKSHSGVRHHVHSLPNRLFNFPNTFETNSWHHQAIKKTAPNLEVVAVSDENVIEAFIHAYLPIIGIQWHPEMMPEDPQSIHIFDVFASLFDR
ncbi:MAG: type 1 glutamine amidotransferase [Bacilli bacterium]|nr:type 1 glutamine amidotransferase [Bacilli bacterium]